MNVPLFSLPEYHEGSTKFIQETVHELMAAKDDLFGGVKRLAEREAPIIQNTMPSGEIGASKAMEVVRPHIYVCAPERV